jgi:hypothetical protein
VLVDDHYDDYHNVIQQCNKMLNLNKKRKNLWERGNVVETSTKKNKEKMVTKIERNKPIAKNNGDGDATKKSTMVIQ